MHHRAVERALQQGDPPLAIPVLANPACSRMDADHSTAALAALDRVTPADMGEPEAGLCLLEAYRAVGPTADALQALAG
jgi:hypothetical protein